MRLLVAVDDSDPSEGALQHAIGVAEAADAEIVLAHAVDPDVYEATGGARVSEGDVEDALLLEAVEDAESEGDALLEAAAERVRAAGVTCETHLLYGSPVDSLATLAEELAVDGVVVGHRSLSERHERLLGSVAKGLVERAPAPVTVVRERDGRW